MTAIFSYKQKVGELKEYVKKNTGLVVHINTEAYPVVISFFKKGTEQLNLFDKHVEDDDKGKTPGLQFIFYEKMEIKTQDDFGVSEEVFNKLKTLAKEVNRLYLNAFCEQVRDKIANANNGARVSLAAVVRITEEIFGGEDE